MTSETLRRQLEAAGCDESSPPADAAAWRRLLQSLERVLSETEGELGALRKSAPRAGESGEMGTQAARPEVGPEAEDGDPTGGRRSVDAWSAWVPLPGVRPGPAVPVTEALMVLDAERRVLSATPALTQLVGMDTGRLLGSEPMFIRDGCGEERYRQIWGEAANQGAWSGEVVALTPEGGAVSLWLSLQAVGSTGGQPTHYVAVLLDALELRRCRADLEYVGTHDALTGLANRALFHDGLERAVHRARRSGRIGALLFIDLDRFKIVNDTLGHQAGDEVLAQVAHRLRSVSRAGDLLARVGGDEFGVVLEGLSAPKDAADAAKKLVGLFAEPFATRGHGFDLSASIGIAIFPGDDGTDPAKLLKRADAAMYEAKQQGGGRVRFHLPEHFRAGSGAGIREGASRTGQRRSAQG